MTVQVAVRLPEAVVERMDVAIQRGWAKNRTRFITNALERDIRRMSAEQDRQILQQKGAADDLDELVAWTAAELVGN